MTKSAKQVPQAQTRAPEEATAKRVFARPTLERQDRLPEITGFSF